MLIIIELIDIAARDAVNILRGSILSMRIPVAIEAGIAGTDGAEIKNPISTYEILRSLIIWEGCRGYHVSCAQRCGD
jgi:hypothetical protein